MSSHSTHHQSPFARGMQSLFHRAATYPQNWLDCPQPITSPCYIAAAIRIFCNSLPNAHAIYPAA